MTRHERVVPFDDWLAALSARHLADLRLSDVTRALRALSSVYVERRRHVEQGAPLDSRGKRAAFALFYGPLHFLAVTHIVNALGAADPPPSALLDLGCGTGTAGAAWAIAAGGRVPIAGLDRHPWALQEARWTYRQMGLRGRTRRSDLARLPPLRPGSAIIAAYVLNEIPGAARARLEESLFDAASRGARVLVVEPIARGITPWWDATAARAAAMGGRADEWRVPIELPPQLGLLDKAAGLRHRELTARSLFLGGRRL